MPTRPRLHRGSPLSGVAAVALFAVLVAVVLAAEFPEAARIAADAHVTDAIGHALFDLSGGDVPSEGFLAAFEIVDVVLVAALVGAVMLARRDGGGDPLEPTDDEGGEP